MKKFLANIGGLVIALWLLVLCVRNRTALKAWVSSFDHDYGRRVTTAEILGRELSLPVKVKVVFLMWMASNNYLQVFEGGTCDAPSHPISQMKGDPISGVCWCRLLVFAVDGDPDFVGDLWEWVDAIANPNAEQRASLAEAQRLLHEQLQECQLDEGSDEVIAEMKLRFPWSPMATIGSNPEFDASRIWLPEVEVTPTASFKDRLAERDEILREFLQSPGMVVQPA